MVQGVVQFGGVPICPAGHLAGGATVTVKVNVLDSVVPPEEAVTVIRVLPAATPVSDPAPSLLPYPLAVAVAVFVGVTA